MDTESARQGLPPGIPVDDEFFPTDQTLQLTPGIGSPGFPESDESTDIPEEISAQLETLTIDLLDQLQMRQSVSIRAFSRRHKVDRRLVVNIVTALSTLNMVRVKNNDSVSLLTNERLNPPIRLANIDKEIEDTAARLQGLQHTAITRRGLE
jgi:hypothetical protein